MAGHDHKNETLLPYLSPAAVWALSVGTSVGWGALVVTSTTYLSHSGPLGTALGLVIGGLLMLLIGWNFHYMANRYPDAGGIYAYTKNVFSYDRAFLVFWFLSLTYISMFWANATSLPLFARYFIHDVFRFGRLYTVFGYDVYLGEALLTLAAIGIVTLLCLRSKQAAARDDILPACFARLNDKHIPENAMILATVLSVPIPFLGRTAIGWVVDVTTIGATIIYGFVSAAAHKTARSLGDRRSQLWGGLGFAIMLVFGGYLLFPSLFSDDALATETYILFIVWSIGGFFYFRRIISRDQARRFGKAIIVWIALLALIVLMALIWSGRKDEVVTEDAIRNIVSYFSGAAAPEALAMSEGDFIRGQLDILRRSNAENTALVSLLFILALGAMLINHFSMRKYEAETARERDAARDVAYRDALTGVKSKHAYVEYERSMAENIYSGEALEFAIVVCDVNGLKHINDTLGHKAGDNYIRAASKLICQCFKHSPVFRIGGDEFAVILQGQDYDDRQSLPDGLNAQIEHNLRTGSVVASLGMADYRPGTDNTFHAVFTRADALMYQRKQLLKRMGAQTRE